MTKHPVALAIALAFTTSAALSGCDRTSNLTELEYIQRAKDFEDKGNLKGSVVELKNALQKNPNSTQARLLLGQIYLKVGMGAEAEKELTQAEKLGVNREIIKPQLGDALLLMGEYKRVLDEIQPSEQTTKDNLARILQLRADALLKQGKLKEACSLFQQSLDSNKSNPPTYWGLAQCAVAEHNMAKAKEWLDAALKIKDKQAKTWIFLGDLEQINNNAQGALAAYTNALKSEPDNLDALQSHATLSLSLGQLEPASKDIEKIRKLSPKSLGANYLQALFNFQQNKYPETRDALQEVFKITPNHMPSVLLAGATAYALGSYQQAETHLNRFLAHFPDHAYARRVLAATQIKQNQPDKALEALAPLLSPGTKDAQALALAGQALLMKRESTQAAEFLERAAAIDPKNASVHTQLGLSHLAMGDTLHALTELETAASLDPSQYKADTVLIMAHLNRKEYDKALIAIDAMEKKLPHSPVIQNMRGNAYLGKNDLGNARKSFEQALAIDPAFFPAAASLAQLDMREQKPEAARKRFEDILTKDKSNTKAMLGLAEIAAAVHDEKEYVSWLEKAARSDPKAVVPRSKLAGFYLSKKKPVDALNVAREVFNANPDNPAALQLLAATQLATGDVGGGLSAYAKLVAKMPYSADAHLRLALAQMVAKKLTEARASLQRALELQPDFAEAQDALIRIDLLENRAGDALRLAHQLQTQRPESPLGFEREADIQLFQGHPSQAVKGYEAALTRGAGSTGLFKLWRALIVAGDNAGAERRLSDWISQHPKDTLAVRANAADFFLNRGRPREAVAQYEALQRIAPRDVGVLNNLAVLYLRTTDSRALPTAEQALKLAPEYPVALDTLGWILLEQGQAPRALNLLRQAASKLPDAPNIRYHYAVALARNGNKAEAKKELEQVVSSGHKFPELEAAKKLLKDLRG